MRGWLSAAYAVGRPLAAARVPPSALTVAGLVVAAASWPIADLEGRWPVLAMVLVVLSGFVDNLDGTVAVLSDRVSRFGGLLDALCDRLADAAYGLALWAVGAPAWLAVVWVGLSWLAEYARARGQVLVGAPIDLVTVGERPTRVVVTAIFLALAGFAPGHADQIVTVGAACGAGAAAVGLLQLVVGLGRRLR